MIVRLKVIYFVLCLICGEAIVPSVAMITSAIRNSTKKFVLTATLAGVGTAATAISAMSPTSPLSSSLRSSSSSPPPMTPPTPRPTPPLRGMSNNGIASSPTLRLIQERAFKTAVEAVIQKLDLMARNSIQSSALPIPNKVAVAIIRTACAIARDINDEKSRDQIIDNGVKTLAESASLAFAGNLGSTMIGLKAPIKAVAQGAVTRLYKPDADQSANDEILALRCVQEWINSKSSDPITVLLTSVLAAGIGAWRRPPENGKEVEDAFENRARLIVRDMVTVFSSNSPSSTKQR